VCGVVDFRGIHWRKPVSQMTDDDMIAIAAYVGSLNPAIDK
jgi:hypothetical protein